MNADQLRASCLVGLADGIRGYTFALWGRPEPAVAGLCDAEFRPTPLARQIAGFLPRLKKLGALLAPCRRIEIAARVSGAARVGFYAAPGGRSYLMVANTDLTAPTTAAVTLNEAGRAGRLRDLESGELVTATSPGNFQVSLPPAGGRLFEVVE